VYFRYNLKQDALQPQPPAPGANWLRIKKTMAVAVMILAMLACNLPSEEPSAVPTASPTVAAPTQAPSPTVPPQPVTPPTTIPLEIEPPTLAPTVPTPVPATPTATLVPTQPAIKPDEKIKMDGTFVGGELTLRTGENGNTIIPKSVRIRKAECKQGQIAQDLLAFDPPPSYPIEDGKFTIDAKGIIVIYGQFTTPKSARGTLTIKINAGGEPCTIGPVVWTASAP